MIVEDELFIALDLQDIVEDMGHRAYGPFSTLKAAMSAVNKSQPDCAILDVRLADGEVFPLAEVLAGAEVPFIFHSAHAHDGRLRARFPAAVICAKPSSPRELEQAIRKALARGG